MSLPVCWTAIGLNVRSFRLGAIVSRRPATRRTWNPRRSTGRPRCGATALVHNAWAFAKFTYLKVNLPSQEEQKGAEKRAKAHQEMAGWISSAISGPGRNHHS